MHATSWKRSGRMGARRTSSRGRRGFGFATAALALVAMLWSGRPQPAAAITGDIGATTSYTSIDGFIPLPSSCCDCWCGSLHVCPDRLAYVVPMPDGPAIQVRLLANVNSVLFNTPIDTPYSIPSLSYIGAVYNTNPTNGTVSIIPGSTGLYINTFNREVDGYDLDFGDNYYKWKVGGSFPLTHVAGYAPVTSNYIPMAGAITVAGGNTFMRESFTNGVAPTFATYTLPTASPFGSDARLSGDSGFKMTASLVLRQQFAPKRGPRGKTTATAAFDTFFTLPRKNLIGGLSADGHFRAWKVPTSKAEPGALTVDTTSGLIWFTEREGNKIVSLDPVKGRFAPHALPHPDSRPNEITVDDRGNVFWTEGRGNAVGLLHAGKITEYPLSPNNSRPAGIEVSPADHNTVYVMQTGVGKIAQLTFTGL